MPVADVMTKEPLLVHATCSVLEALEAAAERGAAHILVCDHGEVVGIACAQCQLSDAKLDRMVGQYMIPARVIEMSASLEEAAERMLALDAGALLVQNHGCPVGVATRGDLVRGGLHCGEDTRERFFCASCGAHEHVHADPHNDHVAYCASCMERAGPPGIYDDVGASD